MKKSLLLLFCVFSIITLHAQTPIPPTDVFISRMSIIGKVEQGSTALIYITKGMPPQEVHSDSNGFFEYKSDTIFKVGSIIIISSRDENNVESIKIPFKVLTDSELKARYETGANQRLLILEKERKQIEEKNREKEELRFTKLSDSLSKLGYQLERVDKDNRPNYIKEADKLASFDAEKLILKSSTLIYKKTILSTNFSIPLVRFNFVTGDDQKQGDILLFNSIGAGFGYYWGRLERTRDDRGEIINEEFSNTFGVNVGALFSAGTGEESKNVFAPTINFAVLDFQVGVGIELGTRAENQKREFVTLSYSIPLYKLFKKSYRILRSYDIPIESVRKTQG
jgi:hypothetical protein